MSVHRFNANLGDQAQQKPCTVTANPKKKSIRFLSQLERVKELAGESESSPS
jgi:hypothetical protein